MEFSIGLKYKFHQTEIKDRAGYLYITIRSFVNFNSCKAETAREPITKQLAKQIWHLGPVEYPSAVRRN